MTYAVPGSYGPAHVPITPLTAIAPFTCDDSNQSSSRSAMLIAISRATSPTVRTSSPRCRHASRNGRRRAPKGAPSPPPRPPAGPQRSEQVGRPLRADLRRHGEQQRPEHVGEPRQPRVPLHHRVGVVLRPLRDLFVVALRIVRVDLDGAAFGERLVVGPHREELVAVL